VEPPNRAKGVLSTNKTPGTAMLNSPFCSMPSRLTRVLRPLCGANDLAACRGLGSVAIHKHGCHSRRRSRNVPSSEDLVELPANGILRLQERERERLRGQGTNNKICPETERVGQSDIWRQHVMNKIQCKSSKCQWK